ncbi:Arp7 protein [Saccharomycopsis crataegensis]|uniref:Arp7 protein n=1 Tax=Saccharomycopsis crataegensis TaxID=43959 RepID=A0AAV5QUQ4_9ASCO|nr:Arp7 protein [Saccharomycopsis crataegensis]
MSFTIPSVVIENGSTNTRAGFSNDEIPPLVFSSNYGENSQSHEIFVGDDIYLKNRPSKYQDLEVFSMLNDGMVYNWDNLEKNWEYIFKSLKVYGHGDSEDVYPLVTTEVSWNSKKNKKKLGELAFEKFEVPSFSLLKNPLCITYGLGRSNGLIIDIGGSVMSVTGVVDGNILTKSAVHSKYAGDYLNFQIFNYLKRSFYPQSDPVSKKLLKFPNVTTSFKNFDLNANLLNDFKYSILKTAQFQITPQNLGNFGVETKNYQLPDGRIININSEQLLLTETLFKPLLFDTKVANNEPTAPVPGIIDLVLNSLNKFRDTPEVISQLLSNIIISGGGASIPDIEKRIYFELNSLLPNFQINCFCNPSLLDRQNAVWIGAGILSSMNNFDGFMSRKEYLELGEDRFFEKFK